MLNFGASKPRVKGGPGPGPPPGSAPEYLLHKCKRGNTEARGAPECYSDTVRILPSSCQKFKILEMKPRSIIRLCTLPFTGVISFNVHDVLKFGERRNLSAVG